MNMKNKIFIVGKPNVGKSSLFNCLSGKKIAIVANKPGLTVDIRKKKISIFNKDYILIDSAGINYEKNSLTEKINKNTFKNICGETLILFLLDGKKKIELSDFNISQELRRYKKNILLVVNKCEGKMDPFLHNDSYKLGFGKPHLISTEHKIGISDLMILIDERFKEKYQQMSSEKNFDHSIAIVGQTNTGKSTLINKLCKSEISIASSKPFLTLDPVEGQFMSGEKTFRIFDTSGMILNSNKKTKIDKVANFETDRKIRLSEIILILMDINNYWEKSNKRIIKKVLDESRCTILVINKIDTKDKFSESYIKEQIFKDLPSVKDFSIFFVSAKKGQGIDKLKKYLSESLLKWSKRIETSKLNKWLKDTLNINPPPLFNGKHIKLKYISQISSKPPKFKIFSNIPRGIKENYKKYLINNLKKNFNFDGYSVKLEITKSRNPYD